MARKLYPGERPANWKMPGSPGSESGASTQAETQPSGDATEDITLAHTASGPRLHPGQRPPNWVGPDGIVPKSADPNTQTIILIVAGIFVGIIALAMLRMSLTSSNPEAAATGSAVATVAAATPVDEKALEGRIDPDAISSYAPGDRKHYPKLFAQLGKRIADVGPLGKKAALLALQTEQCDRVIYVDVSSERSTQNDLQFFVDCADETRVRVTEADIKKGLAQDIDTKETRMARASANIAQYDTLVAKAKDRVLASLRDPGSATFGPVAISHKNGTVACGTVNAKNGFGGMTGAQPFIAFRDSVTLPENEPNFKAQWERHCI